VLIAPICPHFAEKVWKMLRKEGSIFSRNVWPVQGPINAGALRQSTYLKDVVYAFRMKLQVWLKSKAKKGESSNKDKNNNSSSSSSSNDSNSNSESGPKAHEATIQISKSFPEWQRLALLYLKSVYDGNRFNVDNAQAKEYFKTNPVTARKLQDIMGLFAAVKQQLETNDANVDPFELSMPFDERALLESNIDYITQTLEVTKINVIEVEGDSADQKGPLAVPGKPAFVVHN